MKSFNAVKLAINSAIIVTTGAAAYFGLGYFFPTFIGWMFWASAIGGTLVVAGLIIFTIGKIFPSTEEA